jgi:hypothetical protein
VSTKSVVVDVVGSAIDRCGEYDCLSECEDGYETSEGVGQHGAV